MRHNDIILYRFNKNLDTALKNLSILKRQNPGIKVYGLNGGNKDREDQKLTKEYLKEFNKYLEHIYVIKHDDWEWKWKNGDLAIREWYMDFGRKLDFERVYWTEWDVVYLDSIQNCYSHIPRDSKSIAVTCFTMLDDIAEKYAPNYQWLYRKDYKKEYIKLQSELMEKYNYIHLKYTCLFPTGYFTKQFLNDYSSIEVSENSHDEIRVPAYAEILGYTIYDTEFNRDRFNKREEKYFNTWGDPTDLNVVLKELDKPERIRRKVFHPFRDHGSLLKLEKVLFKRQRKQQVKKPLENPFIWKTKPMKSTSKDELKLATAPQANLRGRKLK